MPFYEQSVVGAAAAAGAPYATIHAAGTVQGRIEEIGVVNSGATGSRVALVRPANTPVASTSVLGNAVDPDDSAATVNVDTAWSTAPTLGVVLRRSSMGAAIGSGFVWTWPKDRRPELSKTGAGLWLVLWNDGGSAGTAPTIWVAWQE